MKTKNSNRAYLYSQVALNKTESLWIELAGGQMSFLCLLSTTNQVIRVKMNQKKEFVPTPSFGW